MREHYQVLAITALHSVVAKKADDTDVTAQGRGEGGVVRFRLSGPRGSELQEYRRRDSGRSKYDFQRVGLLTRDHGAKRETGSAPNAGAATLGASLTWCFRFSERLYVDMVSERGSSPSGLFLVCRGRSVLGPAAVRAPPILAGGGSAPSTQSIYVTFSAGLLSVRTRQCDLYVGSGLVVGDMPLASGGATAAQFTRDASLDTQQALGCGIVDGLK